MSTDGSELDKTYQSPLGNSWSDVCLIFRILTSSKSDDKKKGSGDVRFAESIFWGWIFLSFFHHLLDPEQRGPR